MKSPTRIHQNKLILGVVVASIFLLGAVVRLLDLTDPPLDVHGTRQLRNAIVARDLYYQMEGNIDPDQRAEAAAAARAVGQYEPPILESLVAFTYRLIGGETLWVSRVWTTIFWLVGGAFLFDLARRMTTAIGAVIALGFYMLLPFAAQMSRSFQPDTGMVMWFIVALYFLYRWADHPSWRWTILAGVCAGLAALSKVVIAYILAGGAVALVLAVMNFRRAIRLPQLWCMAGLMVLPTLVYYVFISPLENATGYLSSWTLALSDLIFDPALYIRWLGMLQSLFGLTVIFFGLVGVVLSTPRNRLFLAGLWAGYFIYGLSLPYQMYTHNYYHLQLIPILALSIAPVTVLIFERITSQPKRWQLVALGVLLVAALYPAWVTRSYLFAEDFRNEPAFWEQIAGELPEDGRIIALTQDYGYRLIYFGGRFVDLWPNTGEQTLADLRGKSKEFEEMFTNRTAGKHYFLITAFGQYNRQPELQQYLEGTFPVVAERNGYLLFDLQPE